MSAAGITQAGRELARNVAPIIGAPTEEIELALSRMARFAPAYQRIQERWCSDERANNHEPTRRRLEASEARIEAIVRRHFDKLPEGLELRFTGDPRGWCIKLRAADPNRRRDLRGTDWGGEDVGVGSDA